MIGNLGVPKERGVWNSQGGRKDKLFTVFVDQDLGTGVDENEGVTGRKARGLQMEEIAQTVNLYPAKVGNLIRGKQKNLAFILCVCVCV